jgi:hypothetical protein
MPIRRLNVVALLSVMAATISTSPVRAQAAANAGNKTVLIRRILDLTRAVDMAVLALENAVSQQRAASPGVPKEFWDEFTARARRDSPRLMTMLIPVYDRQFSVGQLQQLVTFYQSPLGQHLIKVLPEIQGQSMHVGQEWGAQLGAEVAQDLARRGVQMPRP